MKHQPAFLAALLSLGMTAAYAEDPHAHHHAPAADGRTDLELAPGERAMILEEMRMFLDGVQKMTGAFGKQDMSAVAAAARDMGQKMVHEMPPALRAKLPQEFRQLGFSVHREFDQIALDAESLKDVSYSLNQLSDTLKKCVSCHATYQIQTSVIHDTH
ncbi:MAG: hypothetical protein Q8K12_10690 [Thiobacillus sp.]|nr:hypothetical protein [Thiobacillus sp.]